MQLNICGATDLKLESMNNIKILPRQNLSIIREYEKKSDVLICLCNKKGTQIPGKIYHYAATNKPILIILDGENKDKLKKYFESFNRFILCENNIESISNIINNIKNYKREYNQSEQLNAKNIAKKSIDYIEH